METRILATLGTPGMVVLLILAIVLLGFLAVFASFSKLWIQALSSRAKVTFIELIGMCLRKVPQELIVSARISAAQAGIDLSPAELESVFLVRRDPNDVLTCVNASIMAWKANLPMTFAELQAKHFAGDDVVVLVEATIAAKREGEYNNEGKSTFVTE